MQKTGLGPAEWAAMEDARESNLLACALQGPGQAPAAGEVPGSGGRWWTEGPGCPVSRAQVGSPGWEDPDLRAALALA